MTRPSRLTAVMKLSDAADYLSVEAFFTINEGDISQLYEQFDAVFLDVAGLWNYEADQPVG